MLEYTLWCTLGFPPASWTLYSNCTADSANVLVCSSNMFCCCDEGVLLATPIADPASPGNTLAIAITCLDHITSHDAYIESLSTWWPSFSASFLAEVLIGSTVSLILPIHSTSCSKNPYYTHHHDNRSPWSDNTCWVDEALGLRSCERAAKAAWSSILIVLLTTLMASSHSFWPGHLSLIKSPW